MVSEVLIINTDSNTNSIVLFTQLFSEVYYKQVVNMLLSVDVNYLPLKLVSIVVDTLYVL